MSSSDKQLKENSVSKSTSRSNLVAKATTGMFLMILAALAVVLSASASAATYTAGTPASFCSGTGGVVGGECGEIKGVAVNPSTGNVYLLDTGNQRIEEFGPNGTFIRAFGQNVVATGGQHDAGTGPEVCEPSNSSPPDVCLKGGNSGLAGVAAAGKGIAIDPATGIVYVASLATTVSFYQENGNFIAQTSGNNTAGTGLINAGTPEAFVTTTGVAVDSSTATHYLYVAINVNTSTKTLIDKFTIGLSGIATGSYLCQITGTASATKSSTAASSTECGGNGVAAHKDGAYEGLWMGCPAPCTPASQQQGGNLAVDGSGNLFIAESIPAATIGGRQVVSEFNSGGNYVTQFQPSGGTPPIDSSEPRPEAVAALPSGNVLVAVGAATAQAGGTRVQEYNPSSPGVPVGEFGQGTIGGSVGLAANSNLVYVGDKTNKKVWKYEAPPAGNKLKVTRNGTGTGTVTSNVAGTNSETINCGSHCEETYPAVQVVKLSPAPSAGSTFQSWSGCDAVVETNKCEVT